ncbi:hypothetical protein [Prochlorococcus marinus]|uniref:hypothetical protein n=1 Tax=Prochlorococcus TaxID=1218 RepID=UPI0007B357A3|nr:hypothetical protein [Prochlorococcus marinus]KZR78055.1 hypothetical protein PMIT1323_00503 [Prochlorococcus marinus str. MIT 1323]
MIGEAIDLTPGKDVKAAIWGDDQDVPDELVIGLNDRDPRYHDLWVINLQTGERCLLYEDNYGHLVSVDWIDGDWQLVLRNRIQPDGGNTYDLRLPGQKDWKPFLSLGLVVCLE